MSRSTNRREFLAQAALAGLAAPTLLGGAPALARSLRGFSAADPIRFACIGVGGKGDSDTNDAGKHGEITALCDVDDNTLDKMAAKYPKAKKYNDFRKMLDEMGGQIDAVTVSTPDHTHAPASVMAMRMGKHCFTQKPMAWCVEEARVMRELAAEKNLCTQMGNQGTAENGFRQGVATIKSGILGPIKEIHVWTNRPIWPQGIGRPMDTPEVPKHVHWDEFVAAAPMRPYNKAYHPFAWRGWLDFGTGALGDMACHTINVAAMALELFDPSTVEVVETSGIVDRETYPTWSIIKFQFPERNGRPPLSLTWYDGGENLPKEKRVTKEMLDGADPAGSGLLVMGEKGSFYSKNDYGAEHTLLPKEKFKDVKEPEATLPKSPGHFTEWVEAIKANEPKKALSNFDYAGRLTETVVLGVVALKAGTKIDWDAPNMRARNNSNADQYIRRDYRKGYGIR